MLLEAQKLLFDIAKAAKLIQKFLDGKTYIDYETTEKITEYPRVIAFRNILIHGYAEIDDRLVWNVIESKLPTLITEVDALIV